MEKTSLEDIVADIRSRTDTETPTPQSDHVTDAEIRRWVQQAYREMVDIIIDHGGEEAIDVLAISTTLTSPFTLPVNFYRLVSVDASIDGHTRQLKRQAWRTRHHRDGLTQTTPSFRLHGDAVQFFPSDSAPSSVTLWYIPSMSDVDLDTEVTSFNGWDEFIINAAALNVCAKEETDPTKFVAARQAAMARIITACSNLSTTETQTVLSVARYAEDYVD